MADKGQLIWNRPLAKLIGPVRLDIRFHAKHAKKELSRKHEKGGVSGWTATGFSCLISCFRD
jgi:hypothetical protein